MLVDTRVETSENNTGFNPNVQNQINTPKRNVGITILNVFLCIINVCFSRSYRILFTPVSFKEKKFILFLLKYGAFFCRICYDVYIMLHICYVYTSI